MKTALTISGSDSCGGAGLQCDLKTFSVLGVYGMTAITTVTAQNTLGVKESVDLEPRAHVNSFASIFNDRRLPSGSIADTTSNVLPRHTRRLALVTSDR